MAFTYGGNPAASDSAMVRYLAGDTVDHGDYSASDAEVTAALANQASDTTLAAIEICEILAARCAFLCDTSNAGGLSVSASQRSTAFAKNAARLRSRVTNDAIFGATPLVPGRDKDFVEARNEDEDAVQPFFKRGMHDYASGWTEDSSDDS